MQKAQGTNEAWLEKHWDKNVVHKQLVKAKS